MREISFIKLSTMIILIVLYTLQIDSRRLQYDDGEYNNTTNYIVRINHINTSNNINEFSDNHHSTDTITSFSNNIQELETEQTTQQSLYHNTNKVITLEIDYFNNNKNIDSQTLEIQQLEYNRFIECVYNKSIKFSEIFDNKETVPLIIEFFIYYITSVYTPLFIKLQSVLFGNINQLEDEIRSLIALTNKLDEHKLKRKQNIQEYQSILQNDDFGLCFEYNKDTLKDFTDIKNGIDSSLKNCKELFGGDELNTIHKRIIIISNLNSANFLNKNNNESYVIDVNIEGVILSVFSKETLKLSEDKQNAKISINLSTDNETIYWEFLLKLYLAEESNNDLLKTMKELAQKYLELFDKYTIIKDTQEIPECDIM